MKKILNLAALAAIVLPTFFTSIHDAEACGRGIRCNYSRPIVSHHHGHQHSARRSIRRSRRSVRRSHIRRVARHQRRHFSPRHGVLHHHGYQGLRHQHRALRRHRHVIRRRNRLQCIR